MLFALISTGCTDEIKLDLSSLCLARVPHETPNCRRVTHVFRHRLEDRIYRQWDIDNFAALPDATKNSASFSAGGLEWFVEMCPFGWDEERADLESVGVYLRTRDTRLLGRPALVNCVLEIVGDSEAVVGRREASDWRFSWYGCRWHGWRAMIPRAALLAQKKVSIRVQMEVYEELELGVSPLASAVAMPLPGIVSTFHSHIAALRYDENSARLVDSNCTRSTDWICASCSCVHRTCSCSACTQRISFKFRLKPVDPAGLRKCHLDQVEPAQVPREPSRSAVIDASSSSSVAARTLRVHRANPVRTIARVLRNVAGIRCASKKRTASKCDDLRETVEDMVHFCYTGRCDFRVTKATLLRALNLFRIADKYGLSRLARMVVRCIEQGDCIEAHSVLNVMHVVSLHSFSEYASRLEKLALAYTNAHLRSVLDHCLQVARQLPQQQLYNPPAETNGKKRKGSSVDTGRPNKRQSRGANVSSSVASRTRAAEAVELGGVAARTRNGRKRARDPKEEQDRPPQACKGHGQHV